MPLKYLSKLLFTLFCGITISNGANLVSALLNEDQEKPLTPHTFKCLPNEGRASYKQLMEQNPYHIDENHFSKCMMPQLNTPPSVDLSQYFPTPINQSTLGSCTAAAIVSILYYDMKKQGNETPEIKSALYLYYCERFLEGNINDDTGASISDSITALKKFGVCSESLWPYDIKKYSVKPPKEAYINALDFKKQLNTKRISSVSQKLHVMKNLLSRGSPLVGGIKVCDYFDSKEVENTGIVRMPRNNEKPEFSHAVVFAGYDDTVNGGSFLVLNSWGPKWGTSFDCKSPTKGYFWLPYEYATNSKLAYDFWTFSNLTLLESDEYYSSDEDSCFGKLFKKLFKKLSRKGKNT